MREAASQWRSEICEQRKDDIVVLPSDGRGVLSTLSCSFFNTGLSPDFLRPDRCLTSTAAVTSAECQTSPLFILTTAEHHHSQFLVNSQPIVYSVGNKPNSQPYCLLCTQQLQGSRPTQALSPHKEWVLKGSIV